MHLLRCLIYVEAQIVETINGWACLLHPPTHHCVGATTNQETVGIIEPNQQRTGMGSRLYIILWLLPPGGESASQVSPAASIMWGKVAVDNGENPAMIRIHLNAPNATKSVRGPT